MYFYMLHYPDAERYDVSSLRLAISGAAALPVPVMKGFEQRYHVTVLEGYGLSETSPVASFNVRERQRKPGSIGLPIWGKQMRVVDHNDAPVPMGSDGEIVLRGPNLMKGTTSAPESTAEAMRNGWFHTGDVARIDEEGYFFIVDRKKDMINRGGFNVYPREVEEVLYGHPAVAEAAVIGVPDEALGEEVKAVVVLKANQSAQAEDIISYCRDRIASFKVPALRGIPGSCVAQESDGENPEARIALLSPRLSEPPGKAHAAGAPKPAAIFQAAPAPNLVTPRRGGVLHGLYVQRRTDDVP